MVCACVSKIKLSRHLPHILSASVVRVVVNVWTCLCVLWLLSVTFDVLNFLCSFVGMFTLVHVNFGVYLLVCHDISIICGCLYWFVSVKGKCLCS